MHASYTSNLFSHKPGFEMPLASSREELEILEQCLEKVIWLYHRGVMTHNDMIARIVNEPLLSREEKSLLVKSPTIATLRRIFGRGAVYSIDNVVLPERTLIVTPSKVSAIKLISKYNFIQPVDALKRGADIVAASVLKSASLLVTRRLPREYAVALLVKYANAVVKLIYAIAHAERRSIVSPYLTFVVEDNIVDQETYYRELLEPINAVELRLDGYEKLMVESAIAEYLKRGGSREVLELLGVDEKSLPANTEGWWRFEVPRIDVEYEEELKPRRIDQQKILMLIEHGIKPSIARTIVERLSSENIAINDIARLLYELKYHYSDREIVEKIIPAISAVFNYSEKTLKSIWENIDLFI